MGLVGLGVYCLGISTGIRIEQRYVRRFGLYTLKPEDVVGYPVPKIHLNRRITFKEKKP